MSILAWSILIIYELIFVEQFMIIYSLKKKYKLWKIIFINAIIVLFITFLMIFFISKTEGFGDGGGKFLIFGLLFLIPGFLCYKGSNLQKLIINFSSFSYGIGLYVLSIRIGYICPEKYFYLAVFLCQSILNILTIRFVLKFCKFKLVPTLNNLSKKLKNLLVQFCIVSFLLIIFINSLMTRKTSDFQKIIVVVFLIYYTYITYNVIINYNNESNKNLKLTEMVFTNRTTNLANNVKFNIDIDNLLKNTEQFYLVYIDLDNFKSINDTYGHVIGDEYLLEFGKVLTTLEDDKTKCYHLSGDEFCILTTSSKNKVNEFRKKIEISSLCNIDFLGFSYGISVFPEDGNIAKEIIAQADKKMYLEKLEKRINR